MTASDADLIKTYVREGLGIGVLAEMAFQPEHDTDLRQLSADHLFAPCITWIVLRKESVLREYALDFIGVFAPHLERRAVSNALATAGVGAANWPGVPHWRERRVPSKVVEPVVEAH
jgi:LysR family cys regulon transcriptional activator